MAGRTMTGNTAVAGETATRPEPHGATRHAVFVQLNDPTGNSVLAYQRSGDGSLLEAGRYPTGGNGGAALQAPVDALASQGSLVYDQHHRMLYAVNAGSDTLTVFDVDGARLTRRQIIDSGGAFPVSIAAHGNLLYALNAGDDGTVQGFRITPDGLAPLPGSRRSLRLGNTNPPVFISAPAQIGISPDARHLVVTTKNHNAIDVFLLDSDGCPQGEPVVTATANPVPFSFAFTDQGIAVTEVVTSSVTHYQLHRDGTLTPLSSVADGQAALCWIQPLGGRLYGANAGSGTITAFDLSRDGGVALSGHDGGVVAQPGGAPIDMAASGDYLYVQNPVSGRLDGYHAARDGTLRQVATVTGLPVFADGNGMEGIAAS
ncbi:6-phosphogluconolactonase (cycloisomerase 2 family) [Krasilnikovia cinnamomea]|uniref:6-phosphogluconolactonase (Cycloisomerase 2 family) n=1 Tax=Krasilnikovia cinnamomea TaxID=349313 RepID=A0A4Q7ZQK3_9ACTN|nr:beta-propeller fold lactonase family protein [Krasilnikovia cinnamomea]RZU53402.1 6-phosphogluconolactonase (cycloisomerase 2 family) [Krasilnikovia cinnamomea]